MDEKPKAKNSDLNTRRLKRLQKWGEIANLVWTAGLFLLFAGAIIAYPLEAQGVFRQIALGLFGIGIFISVVGLFFWVLLGVFTVFERAIQWAERRREPAKKKKRH